MKKHSRNRPANGKKPSQRPLPQREDIIRFITENPGHCGKREIAKAFGLKGDDRIWLKHLLGELVDEGVITKRKKRLATQGALPPIAFLDIFDRDSDGGLLARPADWKRADPPVVYIQLSRNPSAITAGVGNRVLAKVFAAREDEPHAYNGRIIRKVEKAEQSVLGILRQRPSGEWRLEPVDRKQPELIIDPRSTEQAQHGSLVEVEIGKDPRYGLKRGFVRDVLGFQEGEKALSTIAILAYGIPHIFPQAVRDAAEQAQPATMANREDWREIPFVTIDPQDAKDHDDAVFAKADDDPQNPGGHIVMVAIADVAAYVRPNEPMDEEALQRGNSVYFPDRVVPMLPERISNNLCSLREGEDRPAMAARMVFNAQGRKLRHSFHRVMIRSNAKLSYEQAQKAVEGINDEKTAALVEPVLNPLWAAYHALKQARDAREPLNLDLPEKKIILGEDGHVKDIYVPERLEAHRLIEEFMIAANVSAAETLLDKKQPFLYRIHDRPSLAKQESLREFLHTINIALARGVDLTPAKFNTLLAQVADSESQELVNQVVLRSQSQAEYSPVNIGHFGLNLHNYAHFTSPIRRYADLVVHRALIKALHFGDDGLTSAEEGNLEDIAVHISAVERRAMAAERDTVDRLIAHYLADRIGVTFEGRITGVTRAGLFINLSTYGADGFVPISTLGSEYFHFDEARHTLVGERSRKGYQLGDVVTIRLVEAMPIAGALRFEMISPARALPFSTQSHHKTGRYKRRSGRNRRH